MSSYALGIDFGTSGVRAIAIASATGDSPNPIVAESRVQFTAGDVAQSDRWLAALWEVLAQIPEAIRAKVQRIACNGTSATVLMVDAQGHPVSEALLYNDDRGQAVQDQLQKLAPADHLVHSPTSSLAKLLWYRRQGIGGDEVPTGWQFLHQADWIAQQLHGQRGVSDYHNALKLGYDVVTLQYPTWLAQTPFASLLPMVLAPGTAIAPIRADLAQSWKIPASCLICTGTTDSIAAFLASGVTQSGEAVTSLGSTLVLKLLSDRCITDLSLGIYSHRLGSRWLVGGASNSGGAVLRHFFSPEELDTLSPHIDLRQPSGLNYYPLLKPGERFPINDPAYPPRLEPRPSSPVEFLKGLLEGIARIEAMGYQLLSDRGANPLQIVYTAGGGAKNATWTKMRSLYLGVPVQISSHREAAYGSARLAQQGLGDFAP